LPVPYVNNLSASDLSKGSTTVKVQGNPTALEDSSEIATSTGDEPGTQGGRSNLSQGIDQHHAEQGVPGGVGWIVAGGVGPDEPPGEQAGQGGDDDSGVAVARLREPLRIEDVAEVADVARPAQTGDATRQRHHRHDLAPGAHSCVLSGVG